ELQAGVPYPAAASAVVRAELAPPAARRLMLRAGLVDAATGLADGVFDEQVEDEAVITRALDVARELGALPAAAYARTKRDLRARGHHRVARRRVQVAGPVALGRVVRASDDRVQLYRRVGEQIEHA